MSEAGACVAGAPNICRHRAGPLAMQRQYNLLLQRLPTYLLLPLPPLERKHRPCIKAPPAALVCQHLSSQLRGYTFAASRHSHMLRRVAAQRVFQKDGSVHCSPRVVWAVFEIKGGAGAQQQHSSAVVGLCSLFLCRKPAKEGGEETEV